MSKFEAFLTANPTDPRVARLNKMAQGPMTLNSRYGKLLGELMREVG